jgi:type II secretory pathway pseudopilin PulG
MMKTQQIRNRGLMMTELIVALAVLGMLMVAFAISLAGFSRLNHYYWAKQRCVSAAQATLDSMAATGAAINNDDLKRLWPGVIIKIDKSQGTGQWKGLDLISVTTGADAMNKKVEVRLSRYFLTNSIAVSKAGDISVLRER